MRSSFLGCCLVILPSSAASSMLFLLLLFLSFCFPPSCLCLLTANNRQTQRQQQTNNPKVVTWSATNPLFSSPSSAESSRTTLSSSLVVYDGTFVHFECPSGGSDQWLVVSAVSEMSLIECQLDSASTPFLICDGANSRKGKTLLFQRESIIASSTTGDSAAAKNDTNRTNIEETILYRHAGTVHHFISTSNGTNRDDMWNSRGGLCAQKNVRIRIEFSDDTPPPPPIVDGTTWIPLEYSIEEMPTWPIEQQTAGQIGRGGGKAGDNGDGGSGEGTEGRGDAHNRLAKSLRIKPEYLEFVRNHAIRGGTGDIRFPPTEEDARDEHVKWPRFVSRNSENPWRRARPAAALYSTNEALQKEPPEERHTDDGTINGNESDDEMRRKSERTRHKGPSPSASPPAFPIFPKDQLVWTTSSATSMKKLILSRLSILTIVFAVLFFRLPFLTSF
ncbi:hypothetical protein niasHT_009035 [Heterodera trifolii]|uniref:Ephrin RBD domain-containing protein n=1 Tax=Heterodera trifolii TaxID=157864 RepID=A0ABD2M2L7_9BILA